MSPDEAGSVSERLLREGEMFHNNREEDYRKWFSVCQCTMKMDQIRWMYEECLEGGKISNSYQRSAAIKAIDEMLLRS